MPGIELIKHLVVVMMENRSFDHYFGALNELEGWDALEGLGQPGVTPNRPAFPADAPAEAPWNMDGASPRIEDPPHEYPEVNAQWNHGAMDGFVAAYQRHYAAKGKVLPPEQARAVMGYYTGATLPVLYGLAGQFAVCDHWFSSFMGSTWPNRLLANAGDCGEITTTGSLRRVIGSHPLPLWGAWEGQKTTDGTAFQWMDFYTDVSLFALWPGFASQRVESMPRECIYRISGLRRACHSGKLPQLVIVEPSYTLASDHPHQDPRRGQRFLYDVVRTVVQSPAWEHTAIIITYDEHGGFYDHVPPPEMPAGSAVPPLFTHLGMRVPSMVISAYPPKQRIVKTQLEHASIAKSVAERWGLPLQVQRVNAATSIWGSCFDFSRPPLPANEVALIEPNFEWDERVYKAVASETRSELEYVLDDIAPAGVDVSDISVPLTALRELSA